MVNSDAGTRRLRRAFSRWDSESHADWRIKNAFLMGWITFHAADFLETFVAYPPTQEPASFTIDQVAKDVDRENQGEAKRSQGG